MTSSTRIENSLPAVILLTVLIFLAASGAGIFGWSLAGAAGILAWAALLRRPPTTGYTPAVSLPWWQRSEWAYFALLAYLVIVLLPLPLPLTTITGGERFTQNSVAATRLRQAAALDAIDLPSLFFSITRNRAGTLRVLAICIGSFSAALLARRLPFPGRRFLLRALIIGGTIVASAGIISFRIIPQRDALWWTINVGSAFSRATAACFVNINHFGGFAAMLCPAAIIAATIDITKRRLLSATLMSLCAIILAAAAPLAESRGGVVAEAAVLFILPLFLLTTRHRRLALWMIVPITILVGVLAIAVIPRVENNMRTILTPTQTASLQERMQVWHESLTIWQHYPLLGAGPNSFHTVYPLHRVSSVTGHRTHAENLYAETLADSGIVGVAIGLWIALAVGAGFRRAHNEWRCDPMLTYSACGAVLVAGVHALVDFAPYVPLYSFTLAALIGLALPPDSDATRFKRPTLSLSALLALVVCFVSPVITRRDSVYVIPKTPVDLLARCIVWAPTSQHAWFYAGLHMTRREDASTQRLGERFMTQSMNYDPMNYRHWRRLGEIRRDLNDRDGARAAYERAHALRDWVKVPANLRSDR